MQLPEELQSAIDEMVQKTSPSALARAREELTRVYKAGGSTATLFADEGRRLAYIAARMPATYGAVHSVLTRMREQCPDFQCRRLLDLGAGPGTASWAAAEVFPSLQKVILVEKSGDAISLGQKLCKASASPALCSGEWAQKSLEESWGYPEADLAVLSYVLGELKNPEEWVEHYGNSSIPFCAIIEPGTPKGFRLIARLRGAFIERGFSIVAPCPQMRACPIDPNRTETAGKDWCHFSARIERTRLHRRLKGGALGFEDEKFSYLVISKSAVATSPSRIIRHPQKLSGHVRLMLCSRDGLEEKVVARSGKEMYRKARDAEWGEGWM